MEGLTTHLAEGGALLMQSAGTDGLIGRRIGHLIVERQRTALVWFRVGVAHVLIQGSIVL